MDLRLNARRKSNNVSVYVVFDLEAGDSNFWVKNLLGALQKKELSTLDSFSFLRSNSQFCYEQTV